MCIRDSLTIAYLTIAYYTNTRYYNSRFDNTLNLGLTFSVNNNTDAKLHGPLIDKLNKLSVILANTLYRLAAEEGAQSNAAIELDKSKVHIEFVLTKRYKGSCKKYCFFSSLGLWILVKKSSKK